MTDDVSKHVFIINGVVEFDPQLNKLKSLTSDLDTITLNVPVSRCLELLLLRRGKVVTQADFFDDVWEKNGTYVTLGTFYQNISLLRKSLKSMGLGDDIILTIPRKGLSITKKTVIEKKLTSEHLPNSSDNVMEEKSNTKIKTRKVFKTTLIYAMLYIVGVTPLSAMYFNDSSSVLGYSVLPDSGSCHVYYFGITNKERVSGMLDSLELDCSKLKYAYITVHPYLPEVSVIQCNKPFNRIKKIECLTKGKVDNVNE